MEAAGFVIHILGYALCVVPFMVTMGDREACFVFLAAFLLCFLGITMVQFG